VRRRPAVPEQGVQGRQGHRYRHLGEVLAAGLSAGPQARTERLQDGKFRDAGGLPIAAAKLAFRAS
ncbi:hypothetical protein NS44R_14520, partial [Mammaliicoccus sciuri]